MPIMAKGAKMANRLFKPTVTKKTSSGPAYFKGWKQWKKGEFIIGEYLSSYETTYRGQTSQNFRFKVLEANFKVQDDLGKLVDPTGKNIILNGVGQLNKFMKDVQAGMLAEIAYGGKEPGKDGTLYHTFERLEAGWPSQVEEEEVDEEDATDAL